MTTVCNYCGLPAQLVNGVAIYPHRADLANNLFWRCEPCVAWVGVHPGTTKPLGILANVELRRLKSAVHSAFDPLWNGRKSHRMTRGRAYRWLARGLGISRDECHIGMFDEMRCRAALEFISANREAISA